MNCNDFITVAIAADKYLGLSHEHVARMCSQGVFKTAFKPGHGRNAHWRISRVEIISHKLKNHSNNLE